jgi:hypothetical protein
MKTMLVYLGCIFYTLYFYTVLFMPNRILELIPAKIIAFPMENRFTYWFFKLDR